MTQTFQFDDIDGINAAIDGEWSEWGPEYVMTQDKIQAFADLTGDQQWIHVDVERAKAGPFGAPIAHGFFTLSLVPVLYTSTVNVTGHSNGVNYGADGLRFLAPVPVDSVLQARTRLSEARPHKKGTILATEVAIHVQGNDVPSVLYNMLTLYQG